MAKICQGCSEPSSILPPISDQPSALGKADWTTDAAEDLWIQQFGGSGRTHRQPSQQHQDYYISD